MALARQLIEASELGDSIYHFRARYAQDWITSVDFPLVWRLQAKRAGALGDLGAHVVDIARFLVRQIEYVAAQMSTFIKLRPRLDKSRHLKRGKMVVDDAVSVIGRFRKGGILNLEATRFAHGRRNHFSSEINGSAGSLAFDLEELNRLRFIKPTGQIRLVDFAIFS